MGGVGGVQQFGAIPALLGLVQNIYLKAAWELTLQKIFPSSMCQLVTEVVGLVFGMSTTAYSSLDQTSLILQEQTKQKAFSDISAKDRDDQ